MGENIDKELWTYMIGGKPIVRSYPIDPIITASCNVCDTAKMPIFEPKCEPLSEDTAKVLDALFDDTQKLIKSFGNKPSRKARKYYKPKFTL